MLRKKVDAPPITNEAPNTNEAPKVVEQTSVSVVDQLDSTDARGLELALELRDSPAYLRYLELLHKHENDASYEVVHSIYNRYLGKESVSLDDVVGSIVKRKVQKLFEKLGIERDNVLLKDIADTSWSLEQQMERMEREASFFDRMIEANGGMFKVGETGSWEDLKTQMDERRQMHIDFERERIERLQSKVDEVATTLELDEQSKNALFDIMQKALPDAMRKERTRIERKKLEVSSLLGILDKYNEHLAGVTSFIDMAGGSGDLGIAIAEKFNSDNLNVRIVDVIPVLEHYVDYLKDISIYDETEERVSFELHPLQDTEIEEGERSKTALVAKHPCGGLKDDIINIAIEKGVPFVMLMTCCQDKICSHPHDYFDEYKSEEIPDIKTFTHILKRSSRTNINPEQFADSPNKYEKMQAKRHDGEEAMDLLDSRSASRLREAGYTVTIEKVGGGKINKGNVIVAFKE